MYKLTVRLFLLRVHITSSNNNCDPVLKVNSNLKPEHTISWTDSSGARHCFFKLSDESAIKKSDDGKNYVVDLHVYSTKIQE